MALESVGPCAVKGSHLPVKCIMTIMKHVLMKARALCINNCDEWLAASLPGLNRLLRSESLAFRLSRSPLCQGKVMSAILQSFCLDIDHEYQKGLLGLHACIAGRPLIEIHAYKDIHWKGQSWMNR